MTEEIGQNVAIAFSNIRKVAIGLDFGNPCRCNSKAYGHF